MTEIGKLEIGAEINTREIDRGTDRIVQALGDVQAAVESTSSDIERTEKSTSKLGDAFAFVGGVGSGIMVSLASKAPALAGAMAKIGVETDELARNLGTALKPAFDAASGALSRLNDFADENPTAFNSIALGMTAIGAALAGIKIAKIAGVGTAITALGTTLAFGLSPAALGVLGLLAGAAGASLALTITDVLGITSRDPGLKEGAKRFGVGIAGGAAVGAAVGSVVPVIGTGIGAIVGAIGGLIFSGVQEYKINRQTQEQNIQFLV